MDHLSQNIKNIAKQKERLPPTHGALSYFIVDTNEFQDHNDFISRHGHFYIVSHIYGALTHGKHEAPVVNPLGREIEWPVGAFQLSSFGIVVDISAVYLGAAEIENCIENEIKSKAYEMLKKAADDTGQAIEQLTTLGAVGIHAALRCQLNETRKASPPR